MQNLWRKEWVFIAAWVLFYCAVVLVVPPCTPLLEPDSAGYIEFVPLRSALYPAFLYLCREIGLNLVQITWVQLGIFGASLAYLLFALRKIDMPRYLWRLLSCCWRPTCCSRRFTGRSSPSESTTPNLLIGMAAMLVQPNMTFTGPRAQTLTQLSARLYETYGPTHKYVADAPTLAVRAQLSAAYEALSQFRALAPELAEAAKRENTTPDALRSELGKQIVRQNIPGYFRLMLLNYFGQWSIAAQNFPPTARALAAYADANPEIAFNGAVSHQFLHPPPTKVGLLVYPAFLIAGAVTFVLSFVFLLFLARPALLNTAEGFYLGVAAFMSAMCHGYTLFISLINECTPRFLMAVVPQIEIVALCLILIILHRCKLIKLRRPI